MAQAKAKTAVESGIYQQYLAERQLSSKAGGANDNDDDSRLDKREERRKKAASGKAGGGAQGRETKTKSTKKHARGGRAAVADDSDDDDDTKGSAGQKKGGAKTLELVEISEIVKGIAKQLEEEGLDHLANTIAELYHRQMNQLALAKAQQLFEATPQSNRRQTHAVIQEKLNTLLVDIRLYEKGLKLFPTDIQTQLVKYLLKSLGNDICNELTLYVAAECNLTIKAVSLNVDQRNKIAQDCDTEYKTPLIEMNKALNRNIDDFVLATEAVLKTCSMIVKKVDKKKDRQLIIQHREKLIQQLQETDEPALVFHLTALVLFTTVTGCILHASGKFVSQIVSLIRPSMSTEQNDLLMQYHDLVLKLLQSEAESNEAKLTTEQLQSMQAKIKDLAASYEKPGMSKAD